MKPREYLELYQILLNYILLNWDEKHHDGICNVIRKLYHNKVYSELEHLRLLDDLLTNFDTCSHLHGTYWFPVFEKEPRVELIINIINKLKRYHEKF